MQRLCRSSLLTRSLKSALCSRVLHRCVLLATFLLPGGAPTQTLARPGWAGSGMTVERWWTHAVLCEMKPDSLASSEPAESDSALHRLTSRLEDLQTVGVDAVLLRDLEPETPSKQTTGNNPSDGVALIDKRYGTLEEFDGLVSEAVRHGMRVLVELRRGSHGADLTDDERFWLNRGVSGLALRGDDPADLRAVRGVLRGYVGERVLIAEKNQGSEPAGIAHAMPLPHAINRRATEVVKQEAGSGNQPDLGLLTLPPVSKGAAAMRDTIERVRAMGDGRAPIPLLSSGDSSSEIASSRVLAAVLLGSGGAALLRVDDLDLAHANGSSAPSTLFHWYRQWSGLHRGNPVMRSGEEILLDHDAEGVLVWVRQTHGGVPLVVICNVSDRRQRLSLVNDFQRLRLRGSFLRTMARSDNGMGAMPLREVVLPAFGVYAGELSR